jgi:hypothetical protein
LVYLYLKCLFNEFLNLSDDDKIGNIDKMAVKIHIHADKAWKNILELQNNDNFNWVEKKNKIP